jgi:hypothetical protein
LCGHRLTVDFFLGEWMEQRNGRVFYKS